MPVQKVKAGERWGSGERRNESELIIGASHGRHKHGTAKSRRPAGSGGGRPGACRQPPAMGREAAEAESRDDR